MIEVSLSAVVATVLMLATAAAFSENLQAIGQASRTSNAMLFLDTTLENVSAVPYADLLALDGNQVFEGQSLARSSFTIDLTVFQVEIGLIQIRAILTDRRGDHVLTRAHLLRAER